MMDFYYFAVFVYASVMGKLTSATVYTKIVDYSGSIPYHVTRTRICNTCSLLIFYNRVYYFKRR